MGIGIGAGMAERDAVQDRPDLRRDLHPVERAMPDRLARHPVADDADAAVGKGDDDRPALLRHLALEALRAELDDAQAIESDLAPPLHLRRDVALALVHAVVAGDRDRRHAPRGLPLRHRQREAFREFLGDEAGREIAGDPARMLHHRRDEGDVVADAVDGEGIERARLRLDRRLARRRVRDELGDHRVVIDRDLAALEDAGVVANHRLAIRPLARRAIGHEPPGRGQEVAGRVLGIDSGFDRPAVELHVGLRNRELLAEGYPDHLLDEIDTGDHLGDRVLDLQTRVHLEEVEGLVLPRHELDRAGRVVVHGLGQRHSLLAHLAAGRLVEQRRRRLLQNLLVAALDRAFALAEIDDVAVLVAENLDLDMAGIDDEFLDEDPVIAEGGCGLRLGTGEAFGDLSRRMGDAHALAAAAGRGLDHHGIADLVGNGHRMLGALDDAEEARNGRNLGSGRCLLRLDLVAHRRDGAGIGADEDDAVILERLGEGLALGQETVAGMHGLRARLLAGVDDLVDQEVGLGGGCCADMHGLIGHFDMQSVAIRIGIDGDRLDTHAPRRLDDTAGDLAAVRDQDLREHARPLPASDQTAIAGVYGMPQLPSTDAKVGYRPSRCARMHRPGQSSVRPDLRNRHHRKPAAEQSRVEEAPRFGFAPPTKISGAS